MRPVGPDSNASPQSDEKPGAGPTAPGRDEALLRVNSDVTVSALFAVLGQDNSNGAPRGLDEPPEPAEPRPEAGEEQGTADCSEGGGLFGFPVSSGRQRPTVRRKGKSGARAGESRDQPTLFDFVHSGEPEETSHPLVTEAPAPAEGLNPPELSPSRVEHDAPPTIAPGERAKARDILTAVRVLTSIEHERRPATSEDRQALARFAGFGPVALSIFPDPVTGRYKDDAWQAIGEELRSLVTPEEYESAKRTTFNAFYTSPIVIAAMHEAISRLGVPENSIVLEPGCGSGNFMSLAPKAMRFIGVELDLLSGRIVSALHPNHDIRIENFRDTRLPDGSVDGVIGNVPFADVKLEYHGQKLSLHDYFFAKSIDTLRPGGVLALVTTHFTLDKQNAAPREYLASKADFVGAIRLPSNAFKREGTAVVTDIILLRKRARDVPANHTDPEWLGVAMLAIEGCEVAINRYFLHHPEMVLGAWSRKDTLYGEGYSVTGNGDLAEQLRGAIHRLPEFTPQQAAPVQKAPAPIFSPPPPERHITEGSFFLDDYRRICQCVDEQTVPVVYGGKSLRAGGTLTARRLAALIRLRDLARRVLQSQNEGWPEKQRSDARRDLNWAYDCFVTSYGPINTTTLSETSEGGVIRRMPNLVKFREDPDAMLVMSLEDYDETTGKAIKAAIMTKDVVGKHAPVTSVRNAEEGLLVSLDQRSTVDMPFIATLYGKPEEQVIVELGDLVFHDPELKTWQTADAYLSGNVRAKLAAVLNMGSAYARNAETLCSVQPEDVLPGDIDANLGAPWIPESDVQAFAAALFHVESSSIQVGHVQKEAAWSIDADYGARQSVAATSEYGTSRAGGPWLLDLALNMKTPVI
jgi:hypothetical protein